VAAAANIRNEALHRNGNRPAMIAGMLMCRKMPDSGAQG
jgi:hypothetical protein